MPIIGSEGAASSQGFGQFAQAATVANYIEDVFSTWLYTGTSDTQTITNGTDLAGKGGLVWIKSRNADTVNVLFDTNRGTNRYLRSSETDAQTLASPANTLTAFNANGFSLGADTGSERVNVLNRTYVSWTFRKQPKFFDVVTYTGDGASSRNIAHSLDSAPGCMIVKRTDSSNNWNVYHRSQGATKYGALNLTDAFDVWSVQWANTEPTSTQFTVGVANNASGATYVAYIFAHDAAGFGLTGTDNVISCGSYTGTGAAGNAITLGYEPQWVMVKATSSTGQWQMYDTMRGWAAGGVDAILYANQSAAEDATNTDLIRPTATGFQFDADYTANSSGVTYIYIAIRRGPMKVPTTGTSVYNAVTWTGDTTTTTQTRSIGGIGLPTDLFIGSERDTSFNHNYTYDRLRGTNSSGGLLLITQSTADEATNNPTYGQYSFAQQNGITLGNYGLNYLGRTYVGWQFRRAPGFFDVVCYTGTGANRTVAHNLAAVPELMIVKERNGSTDWRVYIGSQGNQWVSYLNLTYQGDSGQSTWNSTTPTSTVFSLGVDSSTNGSGDTYVNYLFATCPGVSKVGSFTGTGATQTINCGFTGGARFVLIKSTSTTGNWYVWDSARGIVAGNDPYLLLNSTAAEVTTTDWVDTAATGFELSNAGGNLANSSGVSYIFLAIA
jgi:hypothetical protein